LKNTKANLHRRNDVNHASTTGTQGAAVVDRKRPPTAGEKLLRAFQQWRKSEEKKTRCLDLLNP
jgi:hypothetical protein